MLKLIVIIYTLQLHAHGFSASNRASCSP
uniref:Uncharacterized protein n=1 Tax=Arundo donax TaxID=35708 RepID=A0A0A9FXJ7_ARUDO